MQLSFVWIATIYSNTALHSACNMDLVRNRLIYIPAYTVNKAEVPLFQTKMLIKIVMVVVTALN